MTMLALIRHGATAWNVEGRIQGRSDHALSFDGRLALTAMRLPPQLNGAHWLTSPLRRARETATLLGGDAAIEPRLIEAEWGAWEGLTRAAFDSVSLRMAARGQGGLDMTPPGGESPRDVQARLTALFAHLARREGPFAGVTHKGVIRAALSLATGWDMTGKPPVKLKWDRAHLFAIAPDGAASLIEANIALERA